MRCSSLPLLLGLFLLLTPFTSTSVASANAGLPVAGAGRDSLKAGMEAPTFVMRDLVSDEPFYLRDFTGKVLRENWKKKERHVVVLSFWATWCQPCRIEIPILTKLAAEFKDKPVKFFLVNTMEETTEDSVRIAYKSRGYTLPSLIDPSNRYQSVYTVRGLPMLVVVDKFGMVRKVNRGYHEKFDIELRDLIAELLKEEAPPMTK